MNELNIDQHIAEKLSTLGLAKALKLALFERARREKIKMSKRLQRDALKIIEQHGLTDDHLDAIYSIFTTKLDTGELIEVFGGI